MKIYVLVNKSLHQSIMCLRNNKLMLIVSHLYCFNLMLIHIMSVYAVYIQIKKNVELKIYRIVYFKCPGLDNFESRNFAMFYRKMTGDQEKHSILGCTF